MLEVKGNVWDMYQNYDALCLTTNGFVKKNGECAMGRGIALEAKNRFRTIPFELGNKILRKGNHVHHLGVLNMCNTSIFSFPVKHNWWENAEPLLIERSAIELVLAIESEKVLIEHSNVPLEKILIPRPGCGNGKLKWIDVKPILEKILDDRFYVISF